MKRHIYLVRDTAVDSFMVPMFFQSEGAARRSFSDEVNRASPDNIMFQHPEHFQLFYAGVYDDDTGLFDPVPPVFIVAAMSVFTPAES